MKLVLLAVLLASMQSDTTALVEASKAAKAAKKKPAATKVITNADVKKSKGKLTQRPAASKTDEVKPEPTLLEKQEAERTARLKAEATRAELEKTIAVLEKEVAALETSYYETNDLEYRDKVITAKFAEAKRKLDEARAALPKP